MKKNTVKKGLLPYLLLLVAVLFIMFSTNLFKNTVNILTYSEFESALNGGKVEELTITPRNSALVYEVTGKLEGYDENETFYAKIPLSETIMSKIIDSKDKNKFVLTAESDPDSSAFWQFVVNTLPLLIIVGGAIYIFSKQVGGGNKSFDFGKSKAKLSEDGGKTTFKNVTGLIEEKEEVSELIDFLKTPKKFKKIG